MTTLIRVECKCGVRGLTSQQDEIGSTYVIGSPDLDMRPPPLKRAFIHAWIQACPFCGYCSSDISKCVPLTSEIVRSDAYQRQWERSDYPDLANEFLCWSMIQEKPWELVSALREIAGGEKARVETIQERAERLISAGWASLHAAWVCDDAGNEAAARNC